MPSLTSRNQPGRREDLADVIAVVDARSCEISSMIPKGAEPTNPLGTWQADDYPQPNVKGAVDEKDVTEFENMVGRVPLNGRIQITQRAIKVSRVANNVADVAGVGRKKEFAKSVSKAIIMTKRDIEATILSGNDSQEDNGVAPYQTRGLFAWISANAQADLPVPAKCLTPAGSIYTGNFSGITEQTLRDNLLGSIWDQTGMMGNFQFVVGRLLKSLITSWTVYVQNVESETTVRSFKNDDLSVIRASVDRIEGDTGTMELRLSPWLRYDQDLTTAAGLAKNQQSGLVLDPDMLQLAYNERPNFRAFEDQGGGPRGLVEAIWMLRCLNPKGMGKVDPVNV